MDLDGDFVKFGLLHLLALVVFAVGCVGFVWLGRQQRAAGGTRFSRQLAVAICVFTIPMQILQFLPSEWSLRTSLPLQVCDFAWMVAVYALWTHRPWAVATNFFWGLTLTVQGIITPDLVSGVLEPRFWMFWGMHWLIVWSAVYLVWGLGLRPTWRDYRITVAITLVWFVGAFVFNTIADTNYGYVNAKPKGASLLDYLGPWPLYLVTEVVVVAAVWALMMLAWGRRSPSSA